METSCTSEPESAALVAGLAVLAAFASFEGLLVAVLFPLGFGCSIGLSEDPVCHSCCFWCGL